ncbi:MAG: hypothetical protein Kow002_04600 [Anaerolineales bacterium]
MSTLTPILTVNQEAEQAITWIMSQLQTHGFQVERTFDLYTARLTHSHCPCPHHGTTDCTCQMVVLLIHDNRQQPITFIAHGNDKQTCLSLAESANQPEGAKVIELLELDVGNLQA